MGKKGTFAESPPPRSKVVPGYDWEGAAEKARKRPGAWLFVEDDVPYSLIKSVQQYRRPPFRTDEGYVSVHMRNSHVDEQGVRRGEVHFVWHEREGDQ